MSGKRHSIRYLLFALALLLVSQSASAIVTVGPAGSGCQFTKIQDAIDYVIGKERNSPDDVDPFIGVAGDNFYNEALVIDSGGVDAYVDPFGIQEAFVQIYGNYDQNCNDIPIDTTAGIGAGGSQSGNSVIEVVGGSPVRVVLNHFVLTDGNTDGFGGGIHFHNGAAGYLDLSNVDITGNHASYGGGITIEGHAPGFTLALHPGVTIENNTADNGGGGLYLGGETFAYATEGNVVFVNNTAGSDGGGIAFEGHGNLDLGGVQMAGNHAVNGGAIHVNADNTTAINLYDGVFIAGNTADQERRRDADRRSGGSHNARHRRAAADLPQRGAERHGCGRRHRCARPGASPVQRRGLRQLGGLRRRHFSVCRRRFAGGCVCESCRGQSVVARFGVRQCRVTRGWRNLRQAGHDLYHERRCLHLWRGVRAGFSHQWQHGRGRHCHLCRRRPGWRAHHIVGQLGRAERRQCFRTHRMSGRRARMRCRRGLQ